MFQTLNASKSHGEMMNYLTLALLCLSLGCARGQEEPAMEAPSCIFTTEFADTLDFRAAAAPCVSVAE
jgi:hypothetical protein